MGNNVWFLHWLESTRFDWSTFNRFFLGWLLYLGFLWWLSNFRSFNNFLNFSSFLRLLFLLSRCCFLNFLWCLLFLLWCHWNDFSLVHFLNLLLLLLNFRLLMFNSLLSLNWFSSQVMFFRNMNFWFLLFFALGFRFLLLNLSCWLLNSWRLGSFSLIVSSFSKFWLFLFFLNRSLRNLDCGLFGLSFLWRWLSFYLINRLLWLSSWWTSWWCSSSSFFLMRCLFLNWSLDLLLFDLLLGMFFLCFMISLFNLFNLNFFFLFLLWFSFCLAYFTRVFSLLFDWCLCLFLCGSLFSWGFCLFLLLLWGLLLLNRSLFNLFNRSFLSLLLCFNRWGRAFLFSSNWMHLFFNWRLLLFNWSFWFLFGCNRFAFFNRCFCSSSFFHTLFFWGSTSMLLMLLLIDFHFLFFFL